MYALGLRVSFIAKHTLFRPPIGGLLHWLGGIPVDRRAQHGIVGSMAEVFRGRDRLCLTLTPEGTRGKVTQWRSGFYHIASSANVPIVPIAFDYATRLVKLMPPFSPTGDYEKDLSAIKARFTGVRAKRPDQACL
jgi:1-acyl-sn-glycerol-3-phosphate acyltransferase